MVMGGDGFVGWLEVGGGFLRFGWGLGGGLWGGGGKSEKLFRGLFYSCKAAGCRF